MKKLLTTLVILLAAAFAAAITRPEKEAHLDKIKAVISESIASELSLKGNGTPDDVSSLLGTLGSGVAGVLLDSRLTVDNRYVFSVGRLKDLNGEIHMVSIGAFGHVFTFGKDQLLKAIKGGQ